MLTDAEIASRFDPDEPDSNVDWSEWKAKLRTAFPRRYNFAILLEDLVRRCTLAAESMTSYYHAKLDLCNRVSVDGHKTVSCTIRGLPEDLQANAYAAECTTPEALYNQFLMGLDEYRSKSTVVHGMTSTNRGGEAGRAPMR